MLTQPETTSIVNRLGMQGIYTKLIAVLATAMLVFAGWLLIGVPEELGYALIAYLCWIDRGYLHSERVFRTTSPPDFSGIWPKLAPVFSLYIWPYYGFLAAILYFAG